MTVIDAEVVSESTEIVPVKQGLVLPAASVGEIKEAQNAYHDLCDALLDGTDRQSIGDKSFVKKSGWRKLAVAYNVSCALVSEDLTKDDSGHIIRAKYIVRATAPNGRYMDGVGVCDSTERNFANKQDHDIPATAHTRATNRACADLFGLGEVSAEEVSGGEYHPTARQTSQRPSNQTHTQPGGPTEAQMKFIRKLMDQNSLADQDALKDAEKVTQHYIGDLSELTVSEASQLIDYWKGGT